MIRLLFDGSVALERLDAERLAHGGVVLRGGLGELDGHLGDVGLAGQDLGGHLTGGHAEVIVADGEGRDAAALADALFAADGRHARGNENVCDGLGVGSGGVIGGDVDNVGVVGSGLRDGSDVVGVGKGKFLRFNALIGEAPGDLSDLVAGVGLGGAEQQADLRGIGEPLGDHVGLSLEVSEVGGAGDVAADSAVEVVNIKSNAVSGDGSAEDGNVARGGSGGGQRAGGVRHDEVNAVGNEAVDDGGAVDVVAGSVLVLEFDLAGQRLIQRVDEALGGSVECLVLHELADADGVLRAFAVGAALIVVLCGLIAAAGQTHAQAENEGKRGNKRNDAFGVHAFFPPIFISR